MGMLISLTGVNISQHTSISEHHTIDLKHIPFQPILPQQN